jgi:hypothetical protein
MGIDRDPGDVSPQLVQLLTKRLQICFETSMTGGASARVGSR